MNSDLETQVDGAMPLLVPLVLGMIVVTLMIWGIGRALGRSKFEDKWDLEAAKAVAHDREELRRREQEQERREQERITKAVEEALARDRQNRRRGRRR